MRSVLALVLVLVLGPLATANPDEAPRAGFSKKLEATTLPATLPRKGRATTLSASILITGEIGAD